jgi:hypothetical protein
MACADIASLLQTKAFYAALNKANALVAKVFLESLGTSLSCEPACHLQRIGQFKSVIIVEDLDGLCQRQQLLTLHFV